MIFDVQNLSYTYGVGTPHETNALWDISLQVHAGEKLALIGPTGSGKSTLLRLLAGLLLPTAGRLESFIDKNKIGIAFQYAEYQLFETTILKDVMFGPKNLGLSLEEARGRAKAALASVGIPEAYEEKSPLELSGGEKRRAALAGVLAMEPSVLILDEPAAGLDAVSARELYQLLDGLRKRRQMTILFSTHDMDAAASADRILVLHEGRLLYDGGPRQVFAHAKRLREIGLGLPEVTSLMCELRSAGLDVDASVTDTNEAVRQIIAAVKGR